MSDKVKDTIIESLGREIAHLKANSKHLARLKHEQKLYISYLRNELGVVHSKCHPENPPPDTEDLWAFTGAALQRNMKDAIRDYKEGDNNE